jgi:hypothetical protein
MCSAARATPGALSSTTTTLTRELNWTPAQLDDAVAEVVRAGLAHRAGLCSRRVLPCACMNGDVTGPWRAVVLEEADGAGGIERREHDSRRSAGPGSGNAEDQLLTWTVEHGRGRLPSRIAPAPKHNREFDDHLSLSPFGQHERGAQLVHAAAEMVPVRRACATIRNSIAEPLEGFKEGQSDRTTGRVPLDGTVDTPAVTCNARAESPSWGKRTLARSERQARRSIGCYRYLLAKIVACV